MEKPIRGPALAESVKEYVKNYILENHLKPGDALPYEANLAADLNVGRSSVREAIKALQAAGIVEVRHGQGLYVRAYNLDSIMENLTFGIRFSMVTFQEWLRIRIWLETSLIEEVTRIITSDDIRQIRHIVENWQAHIEKTGVHSPEYDQQFHLTLYRCLNNQILLDLIRTFWKAFQSGEYRDLHSLNSVDASRTLQDHWNILAALEKRDAAAAKAIIAEGFDRYYERMQRLEAEKKGE